MDFRVSRPRITIVAVFLLAFATFAGFGCSSGSVAPSAAVKSHPQDNNDQSISVVPSSLTFASPTAPTQTFVASTQFAGDIGAVSSDVTVATVDPASAPAVKDPNDSRKSVTFTVTPVGPGTCTITVTDKKGNTATVAVTVIAKKTLKIYLTNYFAQTVTTYNLDGTQTTPTISIGPDTPYGIAVDTAGKIYVTHNNDPGSVTTYNPDGTQTTPTISGLLGGGKYGVAVDAVGKIYITNFGNNTVTTYNPDGTQTTPTISSGLDGPLAVAVDATGKIYVTNRKNGTNNGNVTTYNPDGTQTTPTITTGDDNEGIAVH